MGMSTSVLSAKQGRITLRACGASVVAALKARGRLRACNARPYGLIPVGAAFGRPPVPSRGIFRFGLRGPPQPRKTSGWGLRIQPLSGKQEQICKKVLTWVQLSGIISHTWPVNNQAGFLRHATAGNGC